MVKKIFAATVALCCSVCVIALVGAANSVPVSGKCAGIAAAKIPSSKSVGEIEAVACFYGPMPTGVTVSHEGRIFVNFPRWGDEVNFTVAEVKGGKALPFPDAAINRPAKDRAGKTLISVQSVVVDPANRLWLLDTGRIKFGPPWPGGPKLVGVDLRSNRVFKVIPIPGDVALPSTYLNDIRFDLRRGKAGMAFITDSSGTDPGIIVVDLGSGKSWRRLSDHKSVNPLSLFVPIVEGRPLMRRLPGKEPTPLLVGADGIAIGAAGKRLYYCPLSSWSLFSVSVDALVDQNMSDFQVADTVRHEGYKVASDGLESDSENNVYVTGYDQNAILRRAPDNSYETIVHGPQVLWPDTLCLATDGYLYFTANQLHRQAIFHQGKDLREKPYMLFRVKVDKKPVLLK